MLQPGFECRAFPTAAAKSQSQKVTLLPPLPQTLFLLQSRSAPKSVSVDEPSILLEMGIPRSFPACSQPAVALAGSRPAGANHRGHAGPAARLFFPTAAASSSATRCHFFSAAL